MPKKTALVLGAGSSFAYGYPVGSQLRRKIIGLPPGHLDEIQRGLMQDSATFLNDFRRSQLRSIDAFLARRGEFNELGKLAIARVLLEAEAEAASQDLDALKDHWYGYLADQLMRDDWDDFDPSWLSIVTFNYDRSFEHVLHQAIQAAYGKTAEEAQAKMERMRILHVYGTVGGPKQWPYGQGTRDLNRIAQSAHVAAANLRVIPEGRDDDQSLEPIRAALTEAERICFLGFSFDPTNVRRLGAPHVFLNHGQMKELAGTTVGLTDVERKKAVRSLLGLDRRVTDLMLQTFQDRHCEDLLRHLGWFANE